MSPGPAKRTRQLYNEISPYRAAVLRVRMAEGRLPEGIVDERDISTISDADFREYDQVHLFAGIGGFTLGAILAGIPAETRIVTGGFPCQDISNAGKRAGIAGTRSGLWREMVRAIRVVRPQLALVENVAALLGRGMGRVLGDLAENGYDAKWDCVSAADVGAPHLRKRIWIAAHPARDLRRAPRNDRSETSDRRGEVVANAEQSGQRQQDTASGNECDGSDTSGQKTPSGFAASSEMVADAERYRWEQSAEVLCTRESKSAASSENIPDDDGARQQNIQRRRAASKSSRRGVVDSADWWAVEPDVGRVAHGVPARVDRLAALGDAIVPQACAKALRKLLR